MGLSRTVSEINGDSVENRKIPLVYFCVPAEGVPLGIGYRRSGTQTRMMALPGRERSLTISSAIWIVIHRRDRRTDRHRATAKTALTHSVAR